MIVDFLAALQFLTVTPPLLRRAFSAQEMGRAVGWYPLVGLSLGLLLAGATALLDRFFPPPVSAALTLTLWIALTGALHIDGFLDACDGLLGGSTPERRLEIMRDHHIGAFAFAGGALLFLLKFSALLALRGTGWQVAALTVAPMLGRCAMSLAVIGFPYARSAGLGAEIKSQVNWQQVALACTTAIVAAFFFAQWRGLIAIAIASLALLAIIWFTLRRIPGLTGDIYGTICELVELAVLLVFVGY